MRLAGFPSVAVSHGAPTFLVNDTPTRMFLEGFGATIGRPRESVCMGLN